MLISLILVVHLTLVVAVCGGFIFRYVLAIKNKGYPNEGRTPLFVGSAGLVVTGVLLAIIGKLPITTLCLESLGLIVALLAIEIGLQKLSSTLASEKSRLK
ncbi:MAG: hypothetical protein WDN66_00515 [Candidatus Saccharibacteria bacterium]